jgi:hypothetical protein
MAKKTNVNRRQMLDIISNVIQRKHISIDQQYMVEATTKGRKGSMKCQIDTNKEETLLCKFDQGGKNHILFPYYNPNVSGMISMCDYILFVEDDREVFAFSIDLKDTNNSPKQQTYIAQTFVEFIINRIKAVIGENNFPKPVRYRQIGIKTTCDKMTTKGYEGLSYDEDNYLVIPDCHHFYTRLYMDLPTNS